MNTDNRQMGGSHRTCFYVKDNLSFYFASFCGPSDCFLLKQLPKPITFHIYENQYIKSKLCSTCCLYNFYLIERNEYYDAVAKVYLC